MTSAPTPGLDSAVELLERALGYTRVALADVAPDKLLEPTPCAGWTLARLLAHMEDSLDAFTEAASGEVHVAPAQASGPPVDVLRDKACALLGVWTDSTPSTVAVGDRQLHAPLLVAAAALEITVHGWDVAQATGACTPIPSDLARGLHPIAARIVQPADRGQRFGPARLPAVPTGPSEVLLAFLGRRTGPVGCNSAEPPSPEGIAS